MEILKYMHLITVSIILRYALGYSSVLRRSMISITVSIYQVFALLL